MKSINLDKIVEIAYDSLINCYADYCYLIEIGYRLNPIGIFIVSQPLNDYCSFIKQILEMTKRDLTNCLYKLLYDGHGETFGNFLDAFNVKMIYQDYRILTKKEYRNIRGLRNQYIDHNSPQKEYYKLELGNMDIQIIKLIQIYNKVISKHDYKLITKEDLDRIKSGARTGVNLMFDNNTHKIIYK